MLVKISYFHLGNVNIFLRVLHERAGRVVLYYIAAAFKPLHYLFKDKNVIL